MKHEYLEHVAGTEPLKAHVLGTSLVVQWLRLCTPNAAGLIPGQGTRSHKLQLRVHMLQLKIPHAATKRSHMPQLRPGTAK